MLLEKSPKSRRLARTAVVDLRSSRRRPKLKPTEPSSNCQRRKRLSISKWTLPLKESRAAAVTARSAMLFAVVVAHTPAFHHSPPEKQSNSRWLMISEQPYPPNNNTTMQTRLFGTKPPHQYSKRDWNISFSGMKDTNNSSSRPGEFGEEGMLRACLLDDMA